MTGLRIGMVCYPTYGGSGVVATELGKELARRGHMVHFLTYRQPARLGGLEHNVFYHEVSVASYPLFDFPPYEQALAGVIVGVAEVEALDLVHVHYAIPHAAAALQARSILAMRGYHLPVVTTLHGTDITVVGQDQWLRPVVEHALRRSDAVTSVSEFLRDQTLSDYGDACDPRVIPNFVDLDDYHREVDGAFKAEFAPNGEFLVTHISNFRPVKRVLDVVRTFAGIRKQVPAKLLMIGDGPDRSRAETLCRKLGLWDDVVFFGKLRSPAAVLSCSDLFLLPSEQESFGLAALEAMACGVPVISSNRGGLAEVNVHDCSGYLAEMGDVDAMAAYGAQALTCDKTLKRLREGALARASQFAVTKVVPRYEALYADVLA